uniref:Uncharacterized protein n=1 Tax=Aplanochytrium stocchinoi TaxID=215587 RepID=A0A7S3PF72_9STRA
MRQRQVLPVTFSAAGVMMRWFTYGILESSVETRSPDLVQGQWCYVVAGDLQTVRAVGYYRGWQREGARLQILSMLALIMFVAGCEFMTPGCGNHLVTARLVSRIERGDRKGTLLRNAKLTGAASIPVLP